jgi:hypothetical protein
MRRWEDDPCPACASLQTFEVSSDQARKRIASLEAIGDDTLRQQYLARGATREEADAALRLFRDHLTTAEKMTATAGGEWTSAGLSLRAAEALVNQEPLKSFRVKTWIDAEAAQPTLHYVPLRDFSPGNLAWQSYSRGDVMDVSLYMFRVTTPAIEFCEQVYVRNNPHRHVIKPDTRRTATCVPR